MLGADAGGEFRGRAEARDLVVDRETVFREKRGPERDAELVAAGERAEVVGGAFGNGDDDAGVGKKSGEVDPVRGQGFLVGFVAEGEKVGEINDAGGIGVGETHGAMIREGHGAPRNTRKTRKGSRKRRSGMRSVDAGVVEETDGGAFPHGSEVKEVWLRGHRAPSPRFFCVGGGFRDSLRR